MKKKARDSGGEKLNPEFVKYGQKEGQLEFGRLHLQTDDLEAAVTSGAYLQGYDSRHYMSLDIDGHRKGWTLNRCPGSYEVLCGSDTKQNEFGFFLLSENGDIVIRAPRGRIRMSAMDIDLRAEGTDNKRGSINIDSNQSVNIKTGTFDVVATVGARIFTPHTLNIVANTSMNLVSNFINSLTAGSASSPAKSSPPSQTTPEFNKQSSYS